MSRKKIALIGAGNIGGSMALLASYSELADVVLYDIADGLAAGKALDIKHAQSVYNSSVTVTGTSDVSQIEGADVCIVTAGIARKPGMSRDDLLATNAKIMRAVSADIKKYAPNSFVIVVSNPLDAMVTLCQKETGFDPKKVVGMAGVLDSGRYRAFLAEEIGVSVASVGAFVLGGHGDDMVPIRSYTTVEGVPVEKFIKPERLDEIEQRVRKAGGEVVALLKTGSAFCSPGASALEMAESYLNDQKKLLACAALLNGEYGEEGIYMGVPVVIGAGGVEKIVEIELTEQEAADLAVSASKVKELVNQL